VISEGWAAALLPGVLGKATKKEGNVFDIELFTKKITRHSPDFKGDER